MNGRRHRTHIKTHASLAASQAGARTLSKEDGDWATAIAEASIVFWMQLHYNASYI